MRKRTTVALLVVFLSVWGCTAMKGPYYLKQERYEEGLRYMGEQFRENPEDASAAYYTGRYLLALNRPQEGLEYLNRAVSLEPRDADYIFWTGVAHWALLEFDLERAAYERAVALDPEHVSAHLYLGHGHMDRREWGPAVAMYDVVLRLDPYNPEALYNRGLALREMKDVRGEVAAWKRFIEYYPDGSMALTATENLNLRGDFTYRNFIIGKRNITLRSMTFKAGGDELEGDVRPSLRVLSAMLENNPEMVLHVVSYVDGDRGLALQRARSIRDGLLTGHSGIDPQRVPLSWFGAAEPVEIGDNRFLLDQSVNFITEVR